MQFSKFYTDNKYSSWKEIEDGIQSKPEEKERGDLFEEFVYAYFSIKKNFYQIEQIYRYKDIPNEIKKLIKLEDADYGVDGIYVRTDNQIVAYQAKFRSDRNKQPSYRELSTFWAESEHADYRCIISNTYSLPEQSDKKKSQFSILVDSFDALDDDFFNTFNIFTHENKLIKLAPKKPYKYQEDIINNIIKKFDTYNRGKLIAACGTGKTLTALWIKEQLNPEPTTTLFIAPSLSLVKQTIEAWTDNRNKPFSYIAVCSDESVIGNKEDYIIKSASQFNFPVTTDSEEIKNFLSTNNNKVIFSTYQSLDAIANALIQLEDFSFDLAFFDEAHRTAGTKNSELFTYGLDDSYIPIKKRLFMTATEKMVSKRIKDAAKTLEYQVFSMDDENVYGPVFDDSLSFANAIDKGIISDYKIIVACVAEEELESLLKHNKYVNTGDSTKTINNVYKQLIYVKCLNELNLHKTISYHSSINEAQKFINEANGLKLYISDLCPNIDLKCLYLGHVNGRQKAGVRRKIFHDFDEFEYGLMTNVNCLTEGVDIPAIDSVYFADPKHSEIDIIQAVGRTLRKNTKTDSEKTAYVIIPIILKSNGEKSEISECFEPLFDVIQAIRDQDKRLASIIDDINYQAAKTGRINKGSDISTKVVILPTKIDIENIAKNLYLQIAKVNKDPQTGISTTEYVHVAGDRAMAMTRNFKSIVDYAIDSYKNDVDETLKKFTSTNSVLSSNEIKIIKNGKENHNNASHTRRGGFIKQNEQKLYTLSGIGKDYINQKYDFKEILQYQLLKYSFFNKEQQIYLFPYRALFNIFLYIDKLSRLEFLYSLFSAQSTDENAIKKMTERIIYLQNTYYNVEVLNNENKEKVLNILNNKYQLTYSMGDVWSKPRITTAGNQFLYFKNHLTSVYDDIFYSEGNTIIKRQNDANEKIINLLEKTKFITEMIDDTEKFYDCFYNKLY